MLYYLDTNVLVEYLRRGKKAELILSKFYLHTYDNIKIPAVVVCELMYGVFKSGRLEENMRDTEEVLADFEIIPLDYPAYLTYGKIRAELERGGNIIGSNDLLIAATVLSRNGILVTNNIKEFSRIEDLMLEDWTATN